MIWTNKPWLASATQGTHSLTHIMKWVCVKGTDLLLNTFIDLSPHQNKKNNFFLLAPKKCTADFFLLLLQWVLVNNRKIDLKIKISVDIDANGCHPKKTNKKRADCGISTFCINALKFALNLKNHLHKFAARTTTRVIFVFIYWLSGSNRFVLVQCAISQFLC